MTELEEREYLIDLLFESARWKVDHDEVLNGLELEIRDRLRRLSGVNTIDEEGLCQSDLPDNLPAEEEALTSEDFKDLKAVKLNDHLASPDKAAKAVNAWKAKRVRCQENGHPVWHLRSECVKEPRDNRNGGPAWTWKWIGPQDKKKQEDAMWAEHERS
ncbi:hypothetical protein [uncultured Fibrobacter sp.]|uniref:hypothetical protein n=1 Tax=uncultured Fibrobacter sp. TaxID=261512 RepID=UPI0025D45468|nr:hypothetical protein [uncultured Fibrobacter sp.]